MWRGLQTPPPKCDQFPHCKLIRRGELKEGKSLCMVHGFWIKQRCGSLCCIFHATRQLGRTSLNSAPLLMKEPRILWFKRFRDRWTDRQTVTASLRCIDGHWQCSDNAIRMVNALVWVEIAVGVRRLINHASNLVVWWLGNWRVKRKINRIMVITFCKLGLSSNVVQLSYKVLHHQFGVGRPFRLLPRTLKLRNPSLTHWPQSTSPKPKPEAAMEAAAIVVAAAAEALTKRVAALKLTLSMSPTKKP